MKTAVVTRVFTLILTWACCALPAQAALQLIDTVNLRERQAQPLDANVLKLHGAAVDPTRNLVYVAGIVSSTLGVLDGATETWTRNYDTGISGFALKNLEVDSVANRLYVYDTAGNTLRGIDLASGALVGPVAVPMTLAKPAADSRRGLVYMVQSSSPAFSAFNGGDLSLSYSTDAMGTGVAQVIWDERSDSVYALDAGTQGRLRIYKFDPNARAIAGTITLTLGPTQRPRKMAYDASGQRFFVVAGTQVLAVSAAGSLLGQMPLPQEQDVQDISYDPDRNEVAVLVIDMPSNGTQAESGNHLLVFNAATNALARDLPLARKAHTLNYNSANHRYYLPESDASTVWSVPGGGADSRGLRLGDSAEMVALARGGENVYITSRLGGSYLMEWRASTSSLQTFSAGFWPIPMRVSDSGNELYVLNAWDSTLSVYDLSAGRTLSATIPLGIVNGTTDRLPDLAIDSTRQRAYAAYPEFGQIAVVDLAQQTALTPLTVPGFEGGDTGGGPGQLQVRVVPTSGRLFAYWQPARHLTVWDISGATPTLLLDRQLNGMPTIGASFDQLFVDEGRNRVYAGPMELDGTTGLPTGRTLGSGERVIGLDENANVLWTSDVETVNGVSTDVVARLNRDTLAELEAMTRGTSPSVMSTQYAFDASRQRLYAADGQEALLRVYNTAATLPARVTAVEFYHPTLQHYFITADAAEAKGIDRGAAGAGWARTGYAFYAYPTSGAPAGASQVCRFYGTPGVGPNSHFYTADSAECANVKTDPGWYYEGIAFSIGLPTGSACTADTVPVSRAYNGRWQQNDSNHRYSSDSSAHAQMTAQGWMGEGTVFCAPE